jgi:hypothetical protein
VPFRHPAVSVILGDEMRMIKNLIVFFLLLSILTVSGCNKNETDRNEISQIASITMDKNVFRGQELPVILNDSIVITDAFLYNGVFPEDGSFSEKQNVFALKVKNQSTKDLQLIRIEVKTEQQNFFFEITTLPSGKSITVFEKTGKTITDSEIIKEIKGKNIVFFDNKISLHADIFQLMPLNRMMNIINCSDRDIESDVYVYYKKVDTNGDYFGGITFRSNAGPMKAGELKQIPVSAYNPEDSKVVFITYVFK